MKTQWITTLSIVSFAFATEDIYGLDEDWSAPPSKPWTMEIGISKPAGDISTQNESATIYRSYQYTWRMLDAFLTPSLSTVRYEAEDQPIYTVEPSLELGFSSRWVEFSIAGWYSVTMNYGDNGYGFYGSTLLRAARWTNGQILVGPTMESSSFGTETAGLLTSMEQSWQLWNIWHGPTLQITLNEDLADSDTPETMRGRNSSMTTVSTLGDVSYQVYWNSPQNRYSLISEMGYAFSLSTIRSKGKMQRETEDQTGMWASASAQLHW